MAKIESFHVDEPLRTTLEACRKAVEERIARESMRKILPHSLMIYVLALGFWWLALIFVLILLPEREPYLVVTKVGLVLGELSTASACVAVLSGMMFPSLHAVRATDIKPKKVPWWMDVIALPIAIVYFPLFCGLRFANVVATSRLSTKVAVERWSLNGTSGEILMPSRVVDQDYRSVALTHLSGTIQAYDEAMGRMREAGNDNASAETLQRILSEIRDLLSAADKIRKEGTIGTLTGDGSFMFTLQVAYLGSESMRLKDELARLAAPTT